MIEDRVFNYTQSKLDEKTLNSLNKEELSMLYDYIDNIEFLKNLISFKRKRAKDLDRWDNPNLDAVDENNVLVRKLDPNGRIRVDLENPHILENIDYFRQAAISFETTGEYTSFKPSSNPYSDYRKFWDEEIYRCWEGMVRPEDGEWITGYHYWYINYSPIKKTGTKKGSSRKVRITGLPDFYDGDYWLFHYIDRARENGKHFGGLKKRGAGYSLKGASMLSRNFVLGESQEVQKEATSLAIANEKEYLIKDGILNKFVSVIDFTAKNTPFPSTREIKDSFQSMHWQMGRKNTETNLYEGSLNEVMGVTLKNDPEKARGKRAVFILWEEFGKFDNSIKAWNIGRPSVEDGEAVFGQMGFWGTGGTATAAFEGLREIFYNPGGYNVYELRNVWDKNSKETNTCAFFHGGYLNQVGYMDNNGNSDVIGALISIVKERVYIKYNSGDSTTLPQRVAEMACTPQEAIMKVSGNIFPTIDIKEYLQEARVNIAKFTESHLVGDLIINSQGNVDFQLNFNKTPIRSYGKEKENREGAIELFSKPMIDPITNKAYENRYIAGIDPVDQDFILNGSLASIFVFDTWTDEIVAEYTGRPELAEDFYEICRRLIIYYNAIANYENNIKGLFGYFNAKSSLHLLCNTPRHLSDSEEVRQSLFGNSSKGTRTTSAIILEGLKLQRSYMLGKVNKVNSEGKEVESLKLHSIKSLGYLEEAYEFNMDGNFDRVSAMSMLMLLRQERIKITESLLSSEQETSVFEEDDFIRSNYDNRINKFNKNKKIKYEL